MSIPSRMTVLRPWCWQLFFPHLLTESVPIKQSNSTVNFFYGNLAITELGLAFYWLYHIPVPSIKGLL